MGGSKLLTSDDPLRRVSSEPPCPLSQNTDSPLSATHPIARDGRQTHGFVADDAIRSTAEYLTY